MYIDNDYKQIASANMQLAKLFRQVEPTTDKPFLDAFNTALRNTRCASCVRRISEACNCTIYCVNTSAAETVLK